MIPAMERVVFLDRDTVDAHLRSPAYDHVWTDYGHTEADDAAARIATATAVVVNKVPLTEAVLAGAPHLRHVAVAATGTDNVDLDACRRLGIRVTRVAGYAADSVADHVLAVVLALSRNLFAYRRAVVSGAWARSPTFSPHLFGIDGLRGATLGIVGAGAIGCAVAARAEAFGMRVRFAERPGAAQVRPDRVPLDDLFAEADVVSLHCPLTDATRGFVNAERLARMKPTALLVNTARGALVDHAAVHLALLEGRIGGVALDVWPHEPPRDGHALLDLEHDRLVITPHVAWASREAQQTLADRVIDDLEAVQRGDTARCLVGAEP